jgi:hypothetical protein
MTIVDAVVEKKKKAIITERIIIVEIVMRTALPPIPIVIARGPLRVILVHQELLHRLPLAPARWDV